MTIGVRLICEDVGETEGLLKAFWKIEDTVPAPSTNTRPIRAFLIVFFASSRESGLPDDIIYRYPPRIRKNTEASVATTKMDESVWFVKVVTSLFCAAKAMFGHVRYASAKNSIFNNFMFF